MALGYKLTHISSLTNANGGDGVLLLKKKIYLKVVTILEQILQYIF